MYNNSSTGFPDLMNLLINAGGIFPILIELLQGLASLIGLVFIASALIELWGTTNDNALKYMAGRQRFSISSALIRIIIGALLSALSDLELVGILSRTISGDYVTQRIMPTDMQLSSTTSLSDAGAAATMVVLSLMQVVGFVAMLKALLTFNRHFSGEQAHLGTAFTWAIGGVICWNFKWFVDIINNTVGFNIINMFSSF